MDRLQAMETFTRVVEAGGFKRAAETLGVLPSTVTKTIKDLEAHLGVQLLNRTTRAVSITDAGLRYYDSSKAILREVEAAEGAVGKGTGAVRGTVRAGMPPSLARYFIIPALSHFTARFPGIGIDLQLGDAVVDLVQQGIDCVIRAGEPQPSSLVLRRLGAFHWYVCASPAYLERHGEPLGIAALRDHLAVGYADSRTGRPTSWAFQDGDQLHPVSMKTRVTVNDTDGYVAAGVAGLGLIRAASYMVRRQLAEGRLVRILPELEAPAVPLSLLYPQSRHLSPAVRAFIDWCVEVIGTEAKNW
ncbi:LysR family transcriptional regulator [Pseudoroseomonas ludipueritiae]|uniref:LysR family transcriptional regulator n=1 Tax=Pseudoroseomonas ludipueritiae TaxID=198093 RepID=A0ABR7R625_9PROT|nr:LysR family transcriptional regulator [Pseudoroseomonas ludipueritiae]MBC9177133.1 LysR family transcriptional regulator [Pseudoroseomonas ludipueritiae]